MGRRYRVEGCPRAPGKGALARGGVGRSGRAAAKESPSGEGHIRVEFCVEDTLPRAAEDVQNPPHRLGLEYGEGPNAEIPESIE